MGANVKPVEEVRVGEIVRFVPRSQSRRVTVKVLGVYRYGSLMGRRAKTERAEDGSQSIITRGESRAFFAEPGTPVEVV